MIEASTVAIIVLILVSAVLLATQVWVRRENADLAEQVTRLQLVYVDLQRRSAEEHASFQADIEDLSKQRDEAEEAFSHARYCVRVRDDLLEALGIALDVSNGLIQAERDAYTRYRCSFCGGTGKQEASGRVHMHPEKTVLSFPCDVCEGDGHLYKRKPGQSDEESQDLRHYREGIATAEDHLMVYHPEVLLEEAERKLAEEEMEPGMRIFWIGYKAKAAQAADEDLGDGDRDRVRDQFGSEASPEGMYEEGLRSAKYGMLAGDAQTIIDDADRKLAEDEEGGRFRNFWLGYRAGGEQALASIESIGEREEPTKPEEGEADGE